MIETEHLHLLIDEEVYLIPEKQESEGVTQTPFAFFHTSKSKEELELLMKIIGACNLDKFDVFDHQELERVKFSKAIVFTSDSDYYYQVQGTETASIIYARSLSVLLESVDDKAKLWKALKEII